MHKREVQRKILALIPAPETALALKLVTRKRSAAEGETPLSGRTVQ